MIQESINIISYGMKTKLPAVGETVIIPRVAI